MKDGPDGKGRGGENRQRVKQEVLADTFNNQGSLRMIINSKIHKKQTEEQPVCWQIGSLHDDGQLMTTEKDVLCPLDTDTVTDRAAEKSELLRKLLL